MEENFLEELETLPPLYSAALIMQLDMVATKIYKENTTKKNTKKFGLLAGVIPLEEPLYFSVEYLNARSKHPLFYKFKTIEVDDYLDYLNLNKTIDYGNDTN
tara:strand:+ start:227 stop:532 length:306 start_codon:yes stop_codon:yes gene_type:complete